MDRELYPLMAKVEDSHWWFCARRSIVASMLSGLELSPGALILEPGCGTGGNFAMLARFGQVYAMDADFEACKFSSARKTAIVEPGELPDRVPFERVAFDLVVMTDVLEHLDRDEETLSVLRERLKPGGTVRVSIIAETIQNTIVVPATALLNSDEGGPKVMVIDKSSVAHERKISVGVRQGDRVQIVSGLTAGDQVVTSGGLGLEDKAKVTIQKPKEEDEDEDADKEEDDKK